MLLKKIICVFLVLFSSFLMLFMGYNNAPCIKCDNYANNLLLSEDINTRVNPNASQDDFASTYVIANDIFTNFKNIDADHNPLKNITNLDQFLKSNFQSKTFSPLELISKILKINWFDAGTVVTTVADSKLEMIYTPSGGTAININSHDDSDLHNSTDIFAYQALVMGMAMSIEYYVEHASSLPDDNLIKYCTQMTNNFALSIINNVYNCKPEDFAYIFKTNDPATPSKSHDYLIDNFLNNFLYKMFLDNKDNKEALVINAKLFNVYMPTLIVSPQSLIKPFINDGTGTLLPPELFQIDSDNIANLTNYKNDGHYQDYYINAGEDLRSHYLGIAALIRSLNPESQPNPPYSTDNWLYDTLFMPSVGASSSIMATFLGNNIFNYLEKPPATPESTNSNFQIFTQVLSNPQKSQFRIRMTEQLNQTIYLFLTDNNLYKFFSSSSKYITSLILSYNSEKYSDWTTGKILLITTMTILGVIILIIIIYKISILITFKKKYYKYKGNHLKVKGSQ